MTSIADIWLKVKTIIKKYQKWQTSHSFDALVLLTLIPSETSLL